MMDEKRINILKDSSILFILGAEAVALNEKVYVKQSVWERMTAYGKEALYIHELTHIIQQNKKGVVRWLLKYIMNKEYRLQQEVEAYANEFEFRVEHGEAETKLMYAFSELLSSKLYLNMVTQEKASLLLRQRVEKIRSGDING